MTSDADVPVVILAGGRGARFDHESQVRPKPLIEVAGKPILGHIMDSFEDQGFDDFIVLGGYLCDQLSDYLATRYTCRDTVKTHPYITVFGEPGHDVKCHLFDTGEEASTGERLYSLASDFMPREEMYFLTYGDGLADVDLHALLAHHRERRKDVYPKRPCVTLTAVQPPGRFGVIRFDEMAYHAKDHDSIIGFEEKSGRDWINGGFMVVDRGVAVQHIPDFSDKSKDPTDPPMQSFESGALPRLAAKRSLFAYRHTGYWRCMDTRRDLEQIEEDVRAAGRLPWRRV